MIVVKTVENEEFECFCYFFVKASQRIADAPRWTVGSSLLYSPRSEKESCNFVVQNYTQDYRRILNGMSQ